MKQKILITGGAGFIGSHFLNSYVSENPDIDFINIDILTYAGSTSNIDNTILAAENYFFERVDVTDLIALQAVYEKYRPTDIIHFAAETHVDRSIVDPMIFTRTNVIGTQNLLECHRKFNLQRFYLISTDEVYGDIPGEGFFTEKSLIRPSNPYSASKAASEMIVQAYARTYGLDTVMSRCGNNYGPHQDSSKLIPHFIKLLKSDQPVTLYGDGSNIRDWIFVYDHCEAIWTVFQHSEPGEIYNIGWHNELSNLEITKMLIKMMGKTETLLAFVPDRKGHDVRYALDVSKITSELGWSPKVSFGDGLAYTLEYYLTH